MRGIHALVLSALLIAAAFSARAEEPIPPQAPVINSPASGTVIAAGDPLHVVISAEQGVSDAVVILRLDGRTLAVSNRLPATVSCSTEEWTEGEHSLQAVGEWGDRGSAPSPPVTVVVRGVSRDLVAKRLELEALLERLPEVVDGQTAASEIAAYRKALGRLPSDARRWVLDMGQFLEDRKISPEERDLLAYLPQAPDPLLVLTSPPIVNGVDSADVTWAFGYAPAKGAYLYLDQDLAGLESEGLLPSGCAPALGELVAKAETDPEVRKGLYLIYHYGRPPTRLFSWRKEQQFNTQLLMLCHLLHYGLGQDEARLALAAALDYGTLLTVSDRSVWPRVIEYARHRLDYVRETAGLLRSHGSDWDPYRYPLQACLGLLWTGHSEGGEFDLALQYAGRAMNSADLDRLLLRADTLTEMRAHLLEQGLFSRREELRTFAREHPKLGGFYQSALSEAAELCIRLSWQLDIWHPDTPRPDVDWQWYYYQDCGSFSGACGDSGAAGAFLMRSLNIAALQHSHGYWHYVPRDDVWRASAQDLISYLDQQARKGFLWDPVPTVFTKLFWDNLHLAGSEGTIDNWLVFYVTKDASWVPRGIPSGYVFRKGLPRWWPVDYWKSD